MFNLDLIFCFWLMNVVFLGGKEDGGEAEYGEIEGGLIPDDLDICTSVNQRLVGCC